MKMLTLNVNQRGRGTYRRCFYFSRELARAGHEVTMFTVSDSSRWRSRSYFKTNWIDDKGSAADGQPRIRVVEGPSLGHTWLPGWGSGPLDIAMRFREVLFGKYDLVYGFEYHPNVSWPVYLTKHLKDYKFCSDWCDWFGGGANAFRGSAIAHRIDEYLENQIRRRAARVTVTSAALLRRAISIGIPRSRILQVPEGAATDYIEPMPREGARKRLSLPTGNPIVVAVTNGDMLRETRVFGRVLQAVPDTIILVVGAMPARAIALAGDLGISDRLVAPGWVPDPEYPVYLATANVCVCMLRDTVVDRSRWPAKILDFMSAGRATVTNPVGEVMGLMSGQNVGTLAGFGVVETADAIIQLLRSPERADEIGSNARLVMKNRWDWSHKGPELASFLTGGPLSPESN